MICLKRWQPEQSNRTGPPVSGWIFHDAIALPLIALLPYGLAPTASGPCHLSYLIKLRAFIDGAIGFRHVLPIATRQRCQIVDYQEVPVVGGYNDG